MNKSIKVIHYLNQFFAGIGGEEQASTPPQWFDEAKGPGQLLTRVAPEIEVLATVTAGDNYMAENLTKGASEILALIEQHIEANASDRPVLIVAGPAFNAGRYGMACGAVCQEAHNDFGIPAITAVYPENPAVDEYRRDVTMVRTEASVLGMQDAIRDLVHVGIKLVHGEAIDPAQDHTISRGLRQNYFSTSTGAASCD